MPTPADWTAYADKRKREFKEGFHYVQNLVWTNAHDHGWWEEDRSIGDLIALVHTELSEAFEEFRNGRAPDEVYYNLENPDKPEGFGVELADAVIRIMDIAEQEKIDLAALIMLKHEYNKSRPYKHGGKRL